jgi:hypothetical protein
MQYIALIIAYKKIKLAVHKGKEYPNEICFINPMLLKQKNPPAPSSAIGIYLQDQVMIMINLQWEAIYDAVP